MKDQTLGRVLTGNEIGVYEVQIQIQTVFDKVAKLYQTYSFTITVEAAPEEKIDDVD